MGRALIERLVSRGDQVTALTRGTAPSSGEAVRWVQWRPTEDGPWQTALEGQDAVVHLAGESAVGRRYTRALKESIWQSRVESTRAIVRGLEQIHHQAGSARGALPGVLVTASGVGFYGAHDARPIDESAGPGSDFLAEVCVAWEAAALEAERFGVRVVAARLGFVLGKAGGALQKLVPIFKAFGGGPIGSGKQMLSWVHVDDVVGAFLKALDDRSLSGPMNVTGPNPVSNAEFSRALARVLRRPAIVPAPAFALRALYGEGAEPLLTGQAALPRVLAEHGFRHRFTDLDAALQDLLSH